MSKITKAARGKPCTLRVSGYGGCSDPETVVFCHAPSNANGMGMKSPDWWGAFGCQRCHDIIDGRIHIPLYSESESKLVKQTCWNRGIYETHEILIEEGLIEVAA